MKIKKGNVTLKLTRNQDTDEWMVEWFQNGKRSESKTYYTDDKADAIATMNIMSAKLKG